MPSVLTELTEAQKAQIPGWIEKWVKIGLSTEPAQRAEFEEGARACYAHAGLAQPAGIVWVNSPLACVLAGCGALAICELVWTDALTAADAVSNITKTPADAAFAPSLEGPIGTFVFAAARAALPEGHDIPDATRDDAARALVSAVALALSQVLAADPAVIPALDQRLKTLAKDHTTEKLRNLIQERTARNWHTYLGGRFWVSWQSYESFCFDVCDLDIPEKPRAEAFRKAQQSACWWWPHSRYIIASEPPDSIVIEREPAADGQAEGGRLHNPSGPAVHFRDGWSVWAIGGVLVDEQIVMRPETQTITQIRDERNLEVRRIRIERFAGAGKDRTEGWAKYLDAVGAAVVDERDNAVEGTKEQLLKTPDDEQVLVTHCPSTARVYSLDIPVDITTCAAAQQWLWSGSKTVEELGGPPNILGRS